MISLAHLQVTLTSHKVLQGEEVKFRSSLSRVACFNRHFLHNSEAGN